ncbi:MAG: hypothetical protein HEP71_22680 [Roseivirga sp.]|nr:hypothetical protein [Roseivirga sp.]
MDNSVELKSIRPEPYSGSCDLIYALRQLIESDYQELFVCVVVHGSIANKDEINYSDFDGLLIVKDDVLNSRAYHRFITSSQKLILKYDPLQHHGWFMLRESDLKTYPEDYLPSRVLERSALIWPKTATSLEIKSREVSDFQKGFNHLSDHVLAKVDRNWVPQNMYQLKSFLSEIMLLPCLLITALDKAPILKELSFEAAEKRFPAFDWTAMRLASEIRSNWQYTLSPLQKVLMTRPGRFWRKLTEKKIAPKIDKSLVGKLDTNFYHQLGTLINQMKTEVKA